jgi:hypothetical protein
MAKNDNPNVARQGGLGGLAQDLQTGLNYDAEGNVVVPEVRVPDGATVVQQDQIGAFRRTVFSNGAVETIQVEEANTGNDGEIVTPVALPGEQQDVTGTGQDKATKPKMAPSSKTGSAAEKAVEKQNR